MLYGHALKEKLKEMKEERETMICKVGEMMKDGLGYSTIAKILNKPESTIRSWARFVDIDDMYK